MGKEEKTILSSVTVGTNGESVKSLMIIIIYLIRCK